MDLSFENLVASLSQTFSVTLLLVTLLLGAVIIFICSHYQTLTKKQSNKCNIQNVSKDEKESKLKPANVTKTNEPFHSTYKHPWEYDESESHADGKQSDPVMEYFEGEREKLPFMCPFMDAFKNAQKAADAEKEAKLATQNAGGSQLPVKKNDTEKASNGPAMFGVDMRKDAAITLNHMRGVGNFEDTCEKEKEPDIQVGDIGELIRKSNESDALEDIQNFYEHIPGHVKQLEQKKLLEKLGDDAVKEEREARERQLTEIFTLIQEQKEVFGIGSLDEIEDQMRLYVQ